MTRLYLLCGLPAAGKSSLCRLRQGRIITSDIIRLGVLGNTGDSSHDQFVWDLALKAVEYFLEFSDVYYDATNTTKKRRASFICLAHKLGKEVVCVWINTPKKQCLKQNKKRLVALPDWVIENVAQDFENPSLDEGFAWIESWVASENGFKGNFLY